MYELTVPVTVRLFADVQTREEADKLAQAIQLGIQSFIHAVNDINLTESGHDIKEDPYEVIGPARDAWWKERAWFDVDDLRPADLVAEDGRSVPGVLDALWPDTGWGDRGSSAGLSEIREDALVA